MKTFDSGVSHTIVVLNTQQDREASLLMSETTAKHTYKVEALKSGDTFFISNLMGHFLFEGEADSVSLPLSSEAL